MLFWRMFALSETNMKPSKEAPFLKGHSSVQVRLGVAKMNSEGSGRSHLRDEGWMNQCHQSLKIQP